MNTTPQVVDAPVASVSPASVGARSTWQRKALVITGVVLGMAGLAAASTAWWVKHNVYASAMQPVTLTAGEQSSFEGKLKTLEGAAEANPAVPAAAPVDPEVAKRTLNLSEREINAFFAQQGLGEQVKIALTNGGVSATILMPVDKEVPYLGGTTVRFKVSLGAKMDTNKQFAMSIQDVSVGGVPLPNAWLANMKGANLLAETNLGQDPAVKGFLAGIREFEIQEGNVRVILNE
jgi:hypothetical protein